MVGPASSGRTDHVGVSGDRTGASIPTQISARFDPLPENVAKARLFVVKILRGVTARLEVELAMGTLIRRFPDLELLDDMPPMRPTCSLGPGPRGPLHLPVTMGVQHM